MNAFCQRLLVSVAAAAAASAATAADFAAPRSRATLSVEYRFVADGRKQDRVDLWEWKLRRGVDLVAELEAGKPQHLPAFQPMDAAQTARLGQQQVQAQRATTQMAPMIASAQAIMEKCGADDKCMEREAIRLGTAMAGTPQAADAQRTARETEAVMKPGADRYQVWTGRTQKGSYTLDENWHVVHGDPICMRLPGARCRHDLARKGGGPFAPSASPANVEFDLQGNTVVLMLPVPVSLLAYVETQSTDEPEGTHSTPTPRGPQNGQVPLRVTADGQSSMPAPLKVALKGGWRSQSGEQVISMPAEPWHNGGGDGGRLTVKWKFSVQ